MTRYKFEVTTLQDEDIRISARDKLRGELLGYVQISSSLTLERKELIEIAQLYVHTNKRGGGLGSILTSRAIEYALKINKGIHMLIQPGSEGFWRKYFNARFDGKRMTLFGGDTLNSKLAAGVVFEISMASLIQNYKFPQGKEFRSLEIERAYRA